MKEWKVSENSLAVYEALRSTLVFYLIKTFTGIYLEELRSMKFKSPGTSQGAHLPEES